MYEYRAAIISVVDGDTVHAELDLGCDVRFRLTIRLAGLDAPELKTAAGKDAKFVVAQWVAGGAGFTVKTEKDHREKFGRYLATIYRDGDPQSLNAWLLANGNAKPYDGGAR